MSSSPAAPRPPDSGGLRTFHLLVANTLAASVTNNFLWFALTFWVYLETRSVLATAIVGGGYMLLAAMSAMAFGTFVDRHLRATSIRLSSLLSLGAFAAAVRGIALIFIVVGAIGLAVTIGALLSAPYRRLSTRYAASLAASAREEVPLPESAA